MLLPAPEGLKYEDLFKLLAQEDEENETMWTKVCDLGLMEDENWTVLESGAQTPVRITPPAVDDFWFVEWRFIR